MTTDQAMTTFEGNVEAMVNEGNDYIYLKNSLQSPIIF